MKVKKLEDIVLYVGAGSAVLALLLTFLAPAFAGDALAYSGFAVFGMGFVTLFSFNFANPVVLLLFFLFLISLICLGLWCWQLIRNDVDDAESWIKFGAVALSLIFIFSLTAGTFAARINVNDADRVLFDTLKTIQGAGFTKFLDVFSIALCYTSLAACTIYAFVNFGMLNLVGPDYREMKLPFGRKE